ncbi:hypothetical protein [Azorhizobium oxalatiphilum]|nr:hypothetical protein [Azorhizobium oxalatiphilum]
MNGRWPAWIQPFVFTIAACVFPVIAWSSARNFWILMAEGRFQWTVGSKQVWVRTSEVPELYWQAFARLGLELLFSLFWIAAFLFFFVMYVRRRRAEAESSAPRKPTAIRSPVDAPRSAPHIKRPTSPERGRAD